MGKALRDKLPAAGIREPSDVTEERARRGAGPVRAAGGEAHGRPSRAPDRRMTWWPCCCPPICRPGWPGGALGALGPGAAAVLIDDPWRLLDGGEADLRQADRLAERPGQESRRAAAAARPCSCTCCCWRPGRATRRHAARRLMAAAVSRGVPDPVKALERAVEAGRIVVDASRHDPRDAETGAGCRPSRLVSLPRYAMAEESLAEGLARLAARSQPDRRAGRARAGGAR